MLRLALTPLFVMLFLLDFSHYRVIIFVIFLVAALTDKLDGALARSRNLITDFGKLADAMADKALVISALLLLSWSGLLWWWVTVLFIVRELSISLMRMRMRKVKVMAAGKGGKLKMVMQTIGISVLLFPWFAISFLPLWLAQTMVYVGYGFLALALFFAFTSAYEYVREALRLTRELNA